MRILYGLVLFVLVNAQIVIVQTVILLNAVLCSFYKFDLYHLWHE